MIASSNLTRDRDDATIGTRSSGCLQAVVVEDDAVSRRRLSRLLSELPDVEVAGVAATGREALGMLGKRVPHVLFLDLHLPDCRGLDILSRIPVAVRPAVVVVTAFAEEAARAFDFDVSDYVLKPVDGPRLRRAIDRVRRDLAARDAAGDPADEDVDSPELEFGESGHASRFLVPHGGRLVVVKAADVDWFEASGNYIRLHVGPELRTIRLPMQRLEEILAPAEFCRVHRGAIVRLDGVRELRTSASGEYVVRLHDGTELPVSRSHRQKFFAALRKG